jgi:hypothetical protein
VDTKRYKEVLAQLDGEATFEKRGFPAFGSSFRYIDSRMSVFADEGHWAILIETIEVNANSIEHDRNFTVVYRFGNNLCQSLGLGESSFLALTSDGDDGPVFGDAGDSGGYYLDARVQTMRLRGHIVPVPHDLRIYEKKGIELVNKDEIYPEELLRALTPEYREYFFLTEEEKEKEFKQHIPLVLQLEEWRHPLMPEDRLVEKPSGCEAFQLIAKVIATCDPNEYKPTEKPNTHWKNWMASDMYL